MKILITTLLAIAMAGCGKNENAVTHSDSGNVPVSGSKGAGVGEVAQPKKYGGPFGLAMGIPINELTSTLKFKKSDQVSDFFSGTPPRPVEGLDAYYLFGVQSTGLCKIIALTDIADVSGSGEKLKEGVDKFSEKLKLKYGEPDAKLDFSSEDVYRRNPQFWMMGSKEGVVHYGYMWSNSKRKEKLPNDISSILVNAEADSLNKGQIKVSYEFENYKDCLMEMKKSDAKNL